MGKIYVADQQNNRIQVLDWDLKPITTFGREGNGGEFKCPCDVAVSADGMIVYVSDTNNNRVQVFDSDGTFIRQFGEDSLHLPAGICISSSNHVYVVNHEKNCICVFNPEDTSLH